MWTQTDWTDQSSHLLVVCLERFWHWYINLIIGWFWPPLSCADSIRSNIVGGTNNNFVIQARYYQIFTIGSKTMRSSRVFFASMALLANGAPWKRFYQRVPDTPIPISVSWSNDGSEVNRLSNVRVDPAFISHFSIKPNTTSAPWLRPVSGKLVSTPQYDSAWRK